MNTNIQIFNNPNFGEIRIVEVDGKIHFVGSDVSKALGYQNASKALSDHCRGVTKRYIPTNGGMQEMNLSQIINSQEINEYVCELSKLQIYSLAENQLLTTTRGGNDPGTWAHQKVALRVCQKLSIELLKTL
jgi:prophage antirepressor-like protein